MRCRYGLGATLAIGGAVSTASAAFTGFSVQYAGVFSGTDVYYVFANFSESDDVLVSLHGFQLIEGSMSGAAHNDSTGTQASWDPRHTLNSTHASRDSFVTINGVTGTNSVTQLNGFGSGPGIANGASWSSTGPLTAVGSTNRVRIAQFGGQFGNLGGFLAGLSVTYRDSLGSSSSMSGNGTFLIGGVVPAPGALALLALTGLRRSRRR